ncbi:membrane protein [Rugosibacter aromaticivorans]|uniref:Membrane protein n=1 Tax=Rugosibacter aromaticivorans TaxID=1565605 RepID=A0A0C5JIZ7_9PROT|nr:DUF485 domain-containing protein [Rugosibacter aromaticivorans]AJP47301.1 membrane protein [Rugosibacter aromaticivorans]TBR13732.1 MAG: DUF485 domain-containing protein [Rugosibacter sp.]
MKNTAAERIFANPKFHHLVRTRNRYAIVMTLLVVIIYFGYILLVAFDKPFLAQKLGTGWVTSLGIPLGLGVIILTILITAFYVHMANTRFDAMAAELLQEAAE